MPVIPTNTPAATISQLELFLTGQGAADAQLINSAGLSAYAFAVDKKRYAQFRAAFLQQVMLHTNTKTILAPLLSAWQHAGIDVLVFKGFYLAECVYASPALRSYGDVDVLIHPHDIPAAMRIARELEWVETWRRRESLYKQNHEEVNLLKQGVHIEVHRFILDSNSPFNGLQKRFTREAWRNSSQLPWMDTHFRVLHPLDSLLMGLILARCWSGGDNWRLKLHDYSDFHELITTFDVSLAALKARASALACSRTLALFLERCNPWQTQLRLQTPTQKERRYWQLMITPERGHLGVERTMMSVSRLPGTLLDVSQQLLAAQRLRAYTDSALLTHAKTIRAHGQQHSFLKKERIVRGVKWAIKLLKGRKTDVCLWQSVVLLQQLAHAGYNIDLRSAKDSSGVTHYLVHIPGDIMKDVADMQTCVPRKTPTETLVSVSA